MAHSWSKRLGEKRLGEKRLGKKGPTGRHPRAPRLLRIEHFDQRIVLNGDLSTVPFWTGEADGPPSKLLNRFGGLADPSRFTHVTDVVRTGTGAYRFNVDTSTSGNDFAFIPLTGFFGNSQDYVDVRDLITPFSEVRLWLLNGSSESFQLVFEIKDHRLSNAHRVQYSTDISAGTLWQEIVVPLDTIGQDPKWAIDGNPDLTQARQFAIIVEEKLGQDVTGPLHLDDMTFTERGGSLDVATAPIHVLVDRIADRQFFGLWGSRDRATGLVPTISAFANVTGINATAGLIHLLPISCVQHCILVSSNYKRQMSGKVTHQGMSP